MSGFRDQAINEMGLGPVWVLRRAPEIAHSASARSISVEVASEIEVDDRSDLPVDTRGDSMSRDTRIAALSWDALRNTVRSCRDCKLCGARRHAVVGSGVLDTPWMLVGEAPGLEEDEQGLPFVGPSGRLLDNMLAAAGLSRAQEIYVTNVVKCRPPDSARPEAVDVAACRPYLLRQIALVRPRVIIALGAVAAHALLDTDAPVGSLRGQAHVRRFGELDIPVVVMFHPAYILRKLSEKAKAWSDLCLARETFSSLP